MKITRYASEALIKRLINREINIYTFLEGTKSRVMSYGYDFYDIEIEMIIPVKDNKW